MKKYLLGALCATAFLASCNNDDFMLDPVVTGGEGEKIDVVLGATYSDFVGDEADTRMVLVDKKWAWVNGDEIGSMKIVGNQPNSNDKFILADSLDAPTQYATFKTEDGIYGGDYVFYHAFSRDRIKGTNIEVNFPAVQTVDPANATAHLTKQNMWVSPKISFANGIKYGDANKTAIQFVSLNAILKLNISNKSDNGALVVNKVEVVGNTDAFPVKANVNLASGEGVSDPALDPSVRTYADDLDQAIEDMTAATASIVGTASSNTDKISAILSGDGISLASNAETTVYVLIPAGEYGIGTTATAMNKIQELKIYTNKGVFTIAAEDARKGNNKGTATNADFNRNSILNLYPALEGKAKTVAEYDINNLDDWNNGVAYALANRNLTIEFNLKNNLEVSALPECPIYVKGKTLTLKAGKEYTLLGESTFENLTNKGTLNLVDNVAIDNLTNNGTIKVAKTEDIKSSNALDYYVANLTNNGTIQLEGKMTTAATWTNTYDTASSTKKYGIINIVKGGNLVISAATTNAGIINNAGTITLNNTLTNVDAVYYTFAQINIANASGTIKGDFARNQITNNGTIVLDGIKDVFLKKDGKVDEANSAIATGSIGYVQAAIKPADVADLPKIEEINAVSMTGAWDSDAIAKMNDGWTGIVVMAWDGVTLDVDEIGTELESIESLTIDGTSAINNSGNAATELGLEADATITVNGNLTIGEDVTVGAEATTAVEMNVEGSVVNNGEVYAKLTVGSQLPSGAYNTSAKFTNTKDAETHVVSAYAGSAYTYATLVLYGTFVNEGKAEKVNLEKVEFKVTGKSTFTGVYTTNS